jgi:hypothetical protein
VIAAPNLTESLNAPLMRARAIVGGLAHEQAQPYAIARDRILLTLLALNLMLVAFFVVMNASASFDKSRTRAAADSMASVTRTETVVPVDAGRGIAMISFRTAVADIFAAFFPANQIPSESRSSDRVEVNVPVTAFFGDDGTFQEPVALLERIAGVIGAPPSGYRAELFIRGASERLTSDQLAALAQALVQRGAEPPQLSVGVLEPGADAANLRFTFLLMDADDLGVARFISVARGAR